MEERKINPYALWLSDIRGVGNKTIRMLMETAGSAEEVYHMSEDEICMCLTDKLKKKGDAMNKAFSILFAKDYDPIEKAEKLKEKGIGFVSVEDSYYPNRLKDIPNRPYGLYYIGDLPPEDVPCAAIIGARNCSGYGREQASVAGRAAADAGGRSYAVLGCGVDVVYPQENMELYNILKEKGGLISENPPGTEPRTKLFPQRNRLISGLADLVLVIEARRRSGTVITVDSALEQGRDIFALPGRVSDALSDGCNFLISQGAGIACTPESVIEHFFGVSREGTDLFEIKRKERNARRAELSGLEAAAFDALGYGDIMEADFLTARVESLLGMHITQEEFASCMMGLQMKGLAAEIGIGHYKGI